MLWIWTFLTYVNVCPNHCWLSACKRSNSKLLSFQPFLKFRSLSHFPYFLHSLSINLNFLSLHKITAAWACSFLTTSFYFINVFFSCSYETFPMYPSLSYLLLFLHDYIGKKKKMNCSVDLSANFKCSQRKIASINKQDIWTTITATLTACQRTVESLVQF